MYAVNTNYRVKKVEKTTYRKYPKCGKLEMLTMQVSNCGKLEIILRNMADPGHRVVNFMVYNSPSWEIQVVHVSDLQKTEIETRFIHIKL